MAYRYEKTASGNRDLVIDGWEKGIAVSPYQGIANIRNLCTAYYPGVAYVNYARQASTITGGTLGEPLYSAISPTGLIYILDHTGQIFKQSAVNSTTFAKLANGSGRIGSGSGGLAYWNNYLFVFGGGLVEICGDGTGDAGIISTNWNITNGSATRSQEITGVTGGGTNPSYLRLSNTSVQYPVQLKIGDPVTFTTTGTLPAGLATSTTYYVASLYPIGSPNNGYFLVSISYGDLSLPLLGTVSSGATSTNLAFAWGEATGSYDIIFSNGDVRLVTLTNGSSAVSWTGGLSSNASSTVTVAISITSAGTGTHTIVDTSTPVPYGNCTNFSFISNSATGLNLGATTIYLQSYTDPAGRSISNTWQGPNGTYNISGVAGNNILASFTNGSAAVSLLSPVIVPTYQTTGWLIQLLNPTATTYKTWVSKVDGNLYFANGRAVGRILAQNLNNVFNPADVNTFILDYAVTELLQPNDTVVDITDLKSSQIIAGQKDIYVWDYVSATPQAPAPVGETISSIINILNNIYILAGQKGNIYVSNGYSAQLLYKMPDFIAGIIDPVWSWGGLMFHRSRLYFQAVATSTSGTKILSGVFSLAVSSTFLQQESATGLVMEAQNSFGLAPTTSVSTGLLIDNEPSATGADSYYSAWGSGTSATGGIDYNNTTLWQNFEPVIETDIIPTGTFLENETFGNIEFKLDRPMASGDQIRLSYRLSLTANYKTIGTTATEVLSNYFQSDITNSQWVQFLVEFKCAASGSSFIPLREIRLHIVAK
jgi:hypothetical protein